MEATTHTWAYWNSRNLKRGLNSDGIIKNPYVYISHPDVDVPVLCIPGTIANNLPGTDVTVGADTSLNNILNVIDKIKHSGVASR